ncbi:hypothetical protein AgCh_018633 [Apium graveolens]
MIYGQTTVFCTSISALPHISSLLLILGINVYTLHGDMQERPRLKDLWEIVENGYDESVDQTSLNPQQLTALKENRKKDKKALFFIYQAVDEAIFERIYAEETSKEAWNILNTAYKGEDKVKMVRCKSSIVEVIEVEVEEKPSVEEDEEEAKPRIFMPTQQMKIKDIMTMEGVEVVKDKPKEDEASLNHKFSVTTAINLAMYEKIAIRGLEKKIKSLISYMKILKR